MESNPSISGSLRTPSRTSVAANENLPNSSAIAQFSGAEFSNLSQAHISHETQKHPLPLSGTQIHKSATCLTQSTRDHYVAELKVIKEPIRNCRFRYKSEFRYTEGSLRSAHTQRGLKLHVEVELHNFNAPAIIRCSVFQTNIESPHSHQMIVCGNGVECDVHDQYVSSERGFKAIFLYTNIVHVEKKYIFNELLKKKSKRLIMELGGIDLSKKQVEELRKESEKEAKEININQIRFCFEAFAADTSKSWMRIAPPIYSTVINNTNSAQTGRLHICRSSTASGSANGGEEILLLVEKVKKTNIKVVFYEINDVGKIVWEAYARLQTSDVHHDYAITCQIPPYKDENIEKPVEAYIKLLRPSDNRCSSPIKFCYKPNETIISRKRKRISSGTGSGAGSGSVNYSLSSFDVHTTAQNPSQYNSGNRDFDVDMNTAFNEDAFMECIAMNSQELSKTCPQK
ncbi:nuclear factor NF-kappa-B p110 subunit-like [Teleopsis dalmanni]|uniref:nuclear factor NF-kappa-B p110 subunit-like n=1 Tax=Teleopsis dalmanni TaxID=139649 RepID=UPI0018CE8875|nr:nuclear factor NF-kappa-B p110 subunit-like [Teleopsis dalmanni]